MLYGRSLECAAIDRVLADASGGRAGGLVLRGDAGIGKSALLDYAAERAAGMRVLRARGVQAETRLAFAGLHALLRGVVAELDRLPAPQAQALRGALGLAPPVDRGGFLVSAGLLSLLSLLAEHEPVLCLVDDAQWLDAESLDALGFAHRRLESDRIAVLLAVRDDDAGEGPRSVPDGLAEMPLGPLPSGAMAQMLADRLPLALDHRLRDRVLQAARGNPLAAVELSMENALRSGAGESAPLTLSARLERRYLYRVRQLPAAVQRLLLLAAADESGDVGLLLAAGRELGCTPHDLAAAEAASLVRVDGGGLDFAHPLVRSAVYQAGTLQERQAVHAALARALAGTDADRSTWHRAAATVFPDEGAARALEEVGRSSLRRAASGAAARAFERASALTADPHRRVALLLDAAEAWWQSGHAAQASGLVERARGLAVGPPLLARADHLRGRLVAQTGRVMDGFAVLVEGAARIADSDPDLAAAMLVDALRAASYEGDLAAVIKAGGQARRLSTRDDPAPAAAFVAGVAAVLSGDARTGAPLLRSAERMAEAGDDPVLLVWAGTACAYLGDFAGARSYGVRAVTRSREVGALGTLATALELSSIASLWRSLATAESEASEGQRMAVETGQPPSAAVHLATLATVAAIRGDEPVATSHADQVFRLAARHGLAFPEGRAKVALALLDLGLGRPRQALERLEQLMATRCHPAIAISAAGEIVDAAVRAGCVDRAVAALRLLERWAEPAGSPQARALLTCCRALLAEGDEAERGFQDAIGIQSPLGASFLLARMRLLYGEFLRRARRRVDARPHLRAAVEEFDRLGAVPWRERARAELRATGESARPRQVSHANDLTPQELQIARLVAGGAATKEVAAHLFLSPRTVDHHLRRVFAKTGIASRFQLRDLDLGG